MKKILHSKRGTTLVEMLVALTLLCVLLTMICSIIAPTMNSIRMMQQINKANVVIDTVAEDVRSRIENAMGYIKIYDADEPITSSGAAVACSDEGRMLEFKDSNGFVILISTGGCASTQKRIPGVAITSMSEVVSPGRVLSRYYTSESLNTYYYNEIDGSSKLPIARAVERLYTESFYNGFDVQLGFTHVEGLDSSIKLTVTAYYRGKLTASDEFIIDLPYITGTSWITTATALSKVI